MSWFRRPTPEYIPIDPPRKERIPRDMWYKCPKCSHIMRQKEWVADFRVCDKCQHHDRLTADERIALLSDEGTFAETNTHLISTDPLKFEDSKKYTERYEAARKKSGRNEAVVTGTAQIGGVPVSLAVMDFFFMGGSMGCVVGEKIARAMEDAIATRIPCITVAATGGARMQEGILSLMQLAKTSILCKRMQDRGIPFFSILADPSTAGVMASFASLGDITIAEPGALVGFAGRRVIEATIRQSLPADFQTSEFVQKHGFVDLIVHRREMKGTLTTLLRQVTGRRPLDGENPSQPDVDVEAAVGARNGVVR